MSTARPVDYHTPRRAGELVGYTVTYLEMTERPGFPHPHLFGSHPAALIHAEAPPPWYLLQLYDAVGRTYAWEDLHALPEEELAALVASPEVRLYTFLRDGWPHGFFLLDWREAGIADLAYFGLVPEAVGKGLSTWLLQTAILTGWEREGITKMTVNTCTLDHPRALAQYQRHGFRPVRQEERSRKLMRDWDPSRFP